MHRVVLIGRLSLCVSLWLAGLPRQTDAQPARRVPAEAMLDATAEQCRQCSIGIARVATLGEGDNPAGLLSGYPKAVARDGAGRYYVAVSARHYEMVKVYDRSGRFQRVIGRRGNGPGEFEDPFNVVVGRGDSLLIFDDPGISLFDNTGRFVKFFRPPSVFVSMLPNNVVVRSVRDIFFAGNIPSAASMGLPFHRMTLTDSVAMRSFGPAARNDSAGRLRPSEWVKIGMSDRGGFWAASSYEYRLRHWSDEGALTAELMRAADWFVTQPRKRGFTAEDYLNTPPSAAIGSVRENRDSLVWLTVHLPGRNWRQGLRANEGTILEPVWHVLHSTRIEVLSPQSKLVLASRLFDGYVLQFIDAEHFAAIRENQDGEPVVDIWRYEFVRGR